MSGGHEPRWEKQLRKLRDLFWWKLEEPNKLVTLTAQDLHRLGDRRVFVHASAAGQARHPRDHDQFVTLVFQVGKATDEDLGENHANRLAHGEEFRDTRAFFDDAFEA